MRKKTTSALLPYQLLTKKTWADFVTLFGERGACGGCWCMSWRLMKADFEKGKGDDNKKQMKTFVDSGVVPGIIGYDGKQPIAWCSIAPRNHFPRMEKSRVLRPVDDLPVWSVSCLFISKERQRTGLSHRLLLSAIDYALKAGFAETARRSATRPIMRINT